MFSPFILLSVLALFACQAACQDSAPPRFNITVNKQTLFATDILAIPDSDVVQACTANCTAASTALAGCQDNVTCLCSADTVNPLVSCENCMLHFLIAKNKPMPDFRAGSNPVVGAYATECGAAGFTLTPAQSALVLPPTWDGPFVAILPTAGVAVTVTAGAILGFSALYILSNLE
ncbi:hypothetical protein GALMADRAFT_251050 [Galerina marginata CBS 339.88]|uniref:Extracellular membrane protein CFEM domain-containing protein n=1 Tax=Galerina marginata (strain CBS 339.88) TaxID=685588 RepID=A0A067STD3_GALM3|nr:hypothetical protein GALMADRAFT_251050 [Galerina marginata CBS 339.88]